MICHSYYNTYGVPLIVMNVMNAFGERQHPEKFIPLCINKISRGEEITIHAYAGSIKAGSRWYIHARNIAGAVLFVLTQYAPPPIEVAAEPSAAGSRCWSRALDPSTGARALRCSRPVLTPLRLRSGTHGEKYNVQGEIELDNLAVAQFIAAELGKPLKYKMHDNPISRPGHDLRYALDGQKLKDLGWNLPLTFEDSLRRTIRWMTQNPDWLDEGNFRPPDAMPAQKGAPQLAAAVAAGIVAPGAGVRSVTDAPRAKL